MGDTSIRRVRHARRWGVLLAVGLLVPLLGVKAQAEDPLDPVLGDAGRTYPNLVPNVEDVQVQNFRVIGDGFTTEPGLFLWFDTRAQNLGTVPVQLTVDEVQTPETSTVSQCISWRSAENHLCSETEVVGGYTWHDAHNHFHYEDFARYELRRLAADGRPDYSSSGLIGASEKVSFCFIDSSRVRDDARPLNFYLTCTPTVQGISPGWTDIYSSEMAGQNIPIEGLPNGDYALIIDMDYENTLYETSDDDNYIEATIRIFDSNAPEHPSGRAARVLSRNWPAPDDRGTNTTTTTTTTLPGRTPPPRDPDWRPPGWPS